MADGNLDASRRSKKAKRRGDNDALYFSAARTVARCHDLWCEPDKVFKIIRLLQEDEASKAGDLDEDEMERDAREQYLSNISQELQGFSIRTYQKLIQLVPSLKTMINDSTKSDELADISSKISGEIKNTRSTDASRLKLFIPKYASPDPLDLTIIKPSIVITKTKAELGLNHPLLARWLCPIDRLDEFDEDPAHGVMPGQQYDADPDDILSQLFRSYFLIRIARHIFLGPSFAIDPPGKKNRACNAILNDVTTIEPEHIAYVCVHARFGIVAREAWNEEDGDFSYCEMYRAIIRFIKHAEDVEWKDSLLAFWNKEIFENENGRGSTEKKTINKDATPRVSTMERLQARMKIRLALPQDNTSPGFALDPSLPYPSGPSSTVRLPAQASSSRGEASRPFTASTAESSTMGSTSIPEALTPTAPQPSALGIGRRGSDVPTSPLTDPEASAPLTPITNNRKGKQPAKSAKAKGKRPALPDEGADDMPTGGRAGRVSKRRK